VPTCGGISAGNNSILKITGGMIFGNRTGCRKDPGDTGGYGGGGISLYEVAVFEMSGGSVNGNYAGGSGGGICLENYTLVVAEDAYICGNQAKETGGGIISVNRKCYVKSAELIIEGHPKINRNLPNEVVIDEG
jgi:hypothetical protein